MGIKLEEEVREVDEDEDDRGSSAELKEVRCFKIATDSPVQPFVLNETSGTGR